MFCLIKYLAILLVAQLFLVALLVFAKIGDAIVYVFYAIPYILVFPNNGPEKLETPIFVMALFPAVIYAAIFAIGLCIITKLKKKRKEKY